MQMTCFQVDKTLGKTLAAGIEKGEELTEKAQETVGQLLLY